MKQPTISQARAICDAVKARGVIVLAFSEGNVAGASYGETKRECGQLGYTLDVIMESVLNGYIPVWATRESEEARRKSIVREAVEDGTYCSVCEQPKSDCACWEFQQ